MKFNTKNKLYPIDNEPECLILTLLKNHIEQYKKKENYKPACFITNDPMDKIKLDKNFKLKYIAPLIGAGQTKVLFDYFELNRGDIGSIINNLIGTFSVNGIDIDLSEKGTIDELMLEPGDIIITKNHNEEGLGYLVYVVTAIKQLHNDIKLNNVEKAITAFYNNLNKNSSKARLDLRISIAWHIIDGDVYYYGFKTSLKVKNIEDYKNIVSKMSTIPYSTKIFG